jgi:uncharacterized protein
MIEHKSVPPRVLAFLNEIVREYEIELVVLFGSRAYGDYAPFSDCDVAIQSAGLSRLDWLRIKTRAHEAAGVVQISISRLDDMPRKLSDRVRRDGVRIYERA